MHALLRVAASRITTAMSGQEWAIRIARNNVIGCPWVIEPCAFHADPTVLGGVADCLRSGLVVACVVWSLWFGMESVVCGLAVWASAWVGGELPAG